jgi:AraC family transcriptional regulator
MTMTRRSGVVKGADEPASLLSRGTFYGASRGRDVAGARFSIVSHAGARTLAEHAHEAGYFCLLLDGEYEETSEGVTLRYAPLTIAYHPPLYPHADRIGEVGGRFLIIELSQEFQDRIDASVMPPKVSELVGGPAVWLAWRLWEAVFHDTVSAVEVESLLYELCGAASTLRSAEGREPDWLGTASTWLDEHFREHLTVAQAASHAGIHPIHLTRTFRRFRGRGVGEHIQRLRINYATACLREPATPLAQIALDAGFTDQAHFTHICRKLTGQTPAQLRRMLMKAAAT